MAHIGASEMAKRVAPSSPELAAFYSARAGWRNWGEERIRYRLAQKLAQTEPGHAVLDIGGRGGGNPQVLPPGIQYQGLDNAPAVAGPRGLFYYHTQGRPVPRPAFRPPFLHDVREATP